MFILSSIAYDVIISDQTVPDMKRLQLARGLDTQP